MSKLAVSRIGEIDLEQIEDKSKRENINILIFYYNDAMSFGPIRADLAMMQARKVAELMCKLIYAEYWEIPEFGMIGSLLNKLMQNKKIPHSIALHLKNIQNFGNYSSHTYDGAHPQELTSEHVEPSLATLKITMFWYLSEYLNLFSKEVKEELKLADEIAWGQARQRDTKESYLEYIGGNTIKEFVQKAERRIFELEQIDTDEEAWDNAKQINSFEAYTDYLAGHTVRNHKEEAAILIKLLRKQENDEREWKIACRESTPKSYTDYIDKNPEGRYRDEAKSKLREIETLFKEEALWGQTLAEGSISAYEKYLELSSLRIHDQAATKAIEELKAVDTVALITDKGVQDKAGDNENTLESVVEDNSEEKSEAVNQRDVVRELLADNLLEIENMRGQIREIGVIEFEKLVTTKKKKADKAKLKIEKKIELFKDIARMSIALGAEKYKKGNYEASFKNLKIAMYASTFGSSHIKSDKDVQETKIIQILALRIMGANKIKMNIPNEAEHHFDKLLDTAKETGYVSIEDVEDEISGLVVPLENEGKTMGVEKTDKSDIQTSCNGSVYDVKKDDAAEASLQVKTNWVSENEMKDYSNSLLSKEELYEYNILMSGKRQEANNRKLDMFKRAELHRELIPMQMKAGYSKYKLKNYKSSYNDFWNVVVSLNFIVNNKLTDDINEMKRIQVNAYCMCVKNKAAMKLFQEAEKLYKEVLTIAEKLENVNIKDIEDEISKLKNNFVNNGTVAGSENTGRITVEAKKSKSKSKAKNMKTETELEVSKQSSVMVSKKQRVDYAKALLSKNQLLEYNRLISEQRSAANNNRLSLEKRVEFYENLVYMYMEVGYTEYKLRNYISAHNSFSFAAYSAEFIMKSSKIADIDEMKRIHADAEDMKEKIRIKTESTSLARRYLDKAIAFYKNGDS